MQVLIINRLISYLLPYWEELIVLVILFLLVGQIDLAFITSILALGGILYVIIWIDRTLAFITISVLPVWVFIVFLGNEPVNGTTIEQSTKDGKLLAFVQQSLTLL